MPRARVMALEGDVVVHVFFASGIQSLLQCCCVCKPWRDLIRSSWFRKEWSERHLLEQSSVLLSFAEYDTTGKRVGIRRWLPSSSGSDGSSQGYEISPYLQFKIPGFEHSRFDIVASSNGLVCACLDYKSCRYAVGNPVTGDWVHLPEFRSGILKSSKCRSKCRQYTLHARSSGEFKLQVLDFWLHEKADYVLVYSSQTRCWRISKPPVSTPETAMHDLEEGWISVKPPVEIRYGDRDSLNFVTRWSYNDQTYLAGYIDEVVCPVVYLVWKASRLEKQERGTLTQTGDRETWLFWDTGADEKEVIEDLLEAVVNRNLDGNALFTCHGEGRLCAFAASQAYSSRAPGVYDLTSKTWYHLEEFSVRTERYRPKLHCTQAVVYHLSMIKPDNMWAPAEANNWPELKYGAFQKTSRK